jgi:hypothetical protein
VSPAACILTILNALHRVVRRLPADLSGMTISSIASSLSTSQVASSSFSRSMSIEGVQGDDSTSSARISKLGDYMKQLQELQQSDPEKFKEVTAQIAQKLEDAAKTASTDGDTRKSEALTELAGKFKTASQDGTMPDLKPPQGHGPRGAGGHMGPPPGPPPSSSSTDSDDSTTPDDTTSTDSTTSASSTSLARYKELLAMLQQNSDNNPMSVLENVMGGIFSSSSQA